jgi:hypothetical protein
LLLRYTDPQAKYGTLALADESARHRQFQTEMSRADRKIDREKLHVALHRLSDKQIFYILEEAIDLLPEAKLLKLVKSFMDPAALRPDRKAKGSLLADVKVFEKASLAGEYYEAFRVNSRNYMEKSRGTETWIAECERLLDRCVAEAGRGDPTEVCQAFDTIFALLDHVDACLDDVVFFADEGGSWQVGVDWGNVLPAWFTCLAATTEPDEYARRVAEAIDKNGSYRRDKLLTKARKVATPEQRKALRGVL